MPVTLQTFPQEKTTDGKYVATRRSLNVTFRFDLTGSSRSATTQKLMAILEQILASSRAAIEDQKLPVKEITGEWEWVYGPWYKGTLS